LTINCLALLLTLLFLPKCLKFLFGVFLSILGLRADFIVISLHLVDLFLSLLADLNFINRSGEAWSDTETEFSDFLEVTHTILGKKGLAPFKISLMRA
jgi:hypothetical protein